MTRQEKELTIIREEHINFHRHYLKGITFQRFVINAIENEIRRKNKKRLIIPF